jgi:hypothetical protein
MRTKPHRCTFCIHTPLLGHEIDDDVLRFGVDFCAVRVFQTDVPTEFDNR